MGQPGLQALVYIIVSITIPSWQGSESLNIYCGGRYSRTLRMQEFTSPTIGSRGLYPPGVDCVWIFKPPIGEKATLVFERFDLERSVDCGNDYVEVREGRKDFSPLYGRYCGDDVPTMITIEGDIYMKFHTNVNEQRGGFRGHYRVGDCFGHYTDLEGRLATSNFPNPFSKLNCEWRIIVPENYRIRLDFKTFDINSDDRGLCWKKGYYHQNFGMVIVRNGLTHTDSQTIARYCGQYAPIVLSESNTLLITFDTNGGWPSNTRKGFEAFYYAEVPQCEYRTNLGQPAPRYGAHYPTSGIINSRNDTADYPDSDGCMWVINSRNENIMLQFTDFEVEGNDECRDEYVEVRDGDSETSPLIGRFCSSNPPPRVMVTTGKHLFIRLERSDLSNQGTGFIAEYKEGQYRYFNGLEGFISERRIKIEWKGFIEVPRGFLVYLEFPVFSMASRSIDDHFILYGGTEYSESVFLASYMATYAPPILARGNVVTILYKKKWTSEGIGADIKYQAVAPSCTIILKAESGTITNRDVQSQLTQYPECEWRVYSYTAPLVIIEFEDFDLIQSEDCSREYVEIRGPYRNSSNIDRYCGSEKPKMVFMENIFIKFRPESLNSLSRFNITYRSACEYLHDGTNTGTIRIPTPEVERHFQWECLYNVTVDQGNRISLNFTKFNVVRKFYSPNLPSVVEVFDLPSGDVVGSIPHESRPSVIISNSNMISIKVHLYSIESEIEIQYHAEPLTSFRSCAAPSDILYRDVEGAVTSSNYPDVYPPNQNCIWHIEIEPAHLSPVIRFDVFDVGSPPGDNQECSDDYVDVYDGLTTSSRLLGRYCGSEITGQSIVSRERTLTILFHSGENGGGRGFSASYSAECYRVFEDPSAVIPVIEGGKWRTDLCTYEVRPPGGHGAVFDFQNLGIGYYEHLGVDGQPHYIEVKVGKAKDVVAKLWSDYAPILMVPDDVIYLEYRSSYHRYSTFNVSYYQADVACQKAIGNLGLGEDDSAKYPGVVKHVAIPEQCEWGLVNRCGGQVKLRISHHYGYFYKRFFDRESGCRDYIQTRNGLAVNSDVNLKLCRNRVTWLNSISTTDALAVEFVAGAQRKFTYFGTTYDAYCGDWSGGDKYFNVILNESWDDYDVTAPMAPWIAMMWDTNTNQSFCSGVILSNRFILTSATCVSAARRRSTVEASWEGVTIRLGKTESDELEDHEQTFYYNGTHCIASSEDNLCLVKLSHDVTFSRYVSPVCLPTEEVLNEERASEDTYGFTIGWAKLNPNNPYQTKLQRIPLQIQNWQTCQNTVNDDWPYKKQYICAGHVDGDDGGHRCYGHDGAPFLKIWKGRWYLFGVVANDWNTWGHEGCPRRGNYGWFWRTVKIQDEILSTICS